ncbi:MAG: zinc ribbon domain-containing protein [Candidatus Obscuribacterales bacterium]|nr:zinc ribbon domain-containing protein [Candidatus Obscuribacterales bacterium]
MKLATNKSAVSNIEEKLQGQFCGVAPVFEYWCLDCDKFFNSKDLLSECPDCHSSLKDNLVQIYMEHDPEPEFLRSRNDYLAG